MLDDCYVLVLVFVVEADLGGLDVGVAQFFDVFGVLGGWYLFGVRGVG